MDKAEAIKLADKYKSPRYREIERLERYVDGTVWDDRPNFFVDSGRPLLERRPCVRYPIAKIAIRSHADMTLGEGKWPRIKAHGAAKLPDQAKQDFEALVSAVVEQAELRARMRDGLERAMAARSACFVACVRRGKLGVQVFSGKACTLKCNADGDPIELTIDYPYLEEYQDAPGHWTWRVMRYLRVVDEKTDTVYVPAELKSGLPAPLGQVDKTKTRDHGLGFCPVHWYAFMPPQGHEPAVDGCAIHEEQLSEIDILNIGLSQRARAAHYAGDPQVWEAGIGPDENPAPTGRGISAAILDAAGKPYAGLTYTDSGPGRKKGVGVVWSYNDVNTKVGMLTLPGEALTALDDHLKDLKRKIGLALAFVELEPEKASSGQKSSGRALEILLKPQVDFDGRIREDYGEHGICAVVSLLLRVACAADKASPGGVYLDGLEKARPTLESFYQKVAGSDAAVWMPAALDLEWGPFFADTNDDIKDVVDAAIAAKTSKIISARTATASVARAFEVEDVDGEIEQIESEQTGDALDNVDSIQSPTLQKQVATGRAMKLLGKKADDATKKSVADEIASAPGEQPKSTAAPPDDEGEPPPASPAAPAMGADSAGNSGTPMIAADAHLRAASNAGVAETVYQLLSEDYPREAIEWIRSAQIEGPRLVPLEQIDFSNRANWNATDEQDRVDEFVEKISNGEMKPIVLVNEPNDDKLMIIDGHHRALAYEKLGQPAMAYIIHTGTVGGPWDDMHSSQNSLKGRPDAQDREN